MRILLSLLILVLMASDVFGLNLSLGPGLSAKNAVLDFIAMILVVRFVLQGNFKLEIPTIVASYAVMFSYAALSIIMAALVIQYPHYDVHTSLLTLKINIMDPAVVLLTFFYGTRSFADTKALTRVLLGAFTIASLITITNVYGITDWGEMDYGDNNLYEANRVYGFFGHANETGALIAVFLPAYVAVAMSERGILRFGWLVAMMISVVVLIMTGSRGALTGLFIGGAIGAYMCRKYLSPAELIRGGLLLGAVGLPIVALIGAKYGAEFLHRVVSQGSAADVSEVSSGRTLLWMGAISRMMETPLSLITGFGWNVYDSMGFILVPHNHYILLWFELGLIGMACYLTVIRTLLRSALSALRTATPEMQGYLVALVVSIMILSVAILFEQLYKPWYYIWPYMGISLRIAFLARQESAVPALVGRNRDAMVGKLPVTRS